MLLVATVFIACDKHHDDDDDNGTDPSTTEQHLTHESWKIQSVTASGVDVTSQIPACNLDNRLTFNSDGTGAVDEQTSVCSPSNAGAFTWTFQSNQTQISMTTALIPGGPSVLDIVSLSETSMVLSQTTTVPGIPVPVLAVVTLTHP